MCHHQDMDLGKYRHDGSTQMDTYSAIVESIKRIPPLSQSAFQLMAGAESNTMSMKQIAEIVTQDPALTCNVLKVVNAPAFGLGQSITSVSKAVSFLGLKMVVALALATCSPEIFGVPLAGYEAERGELWLHALYTALASREIIKYAKQPISSELVFTAGIVHDIGKAILSDALSGRATSFFDLPKNQQVDGFTCLEHIELGGDHCKAGLALAEHWHLPDPLAQVIRYHHTPQLASPKWRSLVYTIHVADMLSMMAGVGTGIDCLLYPLDEDYNQLFFLSENILEQIILELSDGFSRYKTAL